MAETPGQYTYEFPRPGVAADVVVVSLDKEPQVLLIQRKLEPFEGWWALPGGFVNRDETLAAAAARELLEETGVADLQLEQLGAFGDPGRDPRDWVVSVVFFARADRSNIKPKAGDDAAACCWHPLDRLPEKLAFDHDRILARARARLLATAQ